ncbi:transposase [Streptomyces sp. NPDC048156]|uniref:transposase n=1 Tax=Streptomyces sp. NPDC048156 TaxID=3365502 RepID=UPI0037170137
MAEPRRPPGGGGAGGEGLGRSRGGFTSKLHLSADGRCRPRSLVVTPGQRVDCTRFTSVLENIRVPRVGPGRPRTKPDSLAANKAYSNGPCGDYLRRRGIRHTIPEKTDSQAVRLRKGPRGGGDGHRASTRSG